MNRFIFGLTTVLFLFGLVGTANAAKFATITKILTTAAPADIGDSATWQITVTNTSTAGEAITNVEVTDVLGAGFQFGDATESGYNTGQITTWGSAEYASLASIAAGNSLSMEITATVTATENLENRADVRFGLDPSPLPAEFDSAVDGGTAIVVYSATPPRVSSITRQSPSSSPTAQDTVTWRVTFSEDVKNVDPTDFSVAGTTATVSSVTGGASSYDVTISGGDLADLDGTVTLSFAGGQNIQDLFATALTDTTPTGTNNNTFLMQQDTESPSVAILNAPATLANQDPFSVTFEFSEDVTGFAVGDITVGNGNATNFGTTDANTYTADITPTGAGDLTIDINAGVAQDAASNPNTAATQVLVSCGSGCGEDATIAHTQRVLQNYTGKRIRHITAQGPELSALLIEDGKGGGINGFFNTPFDLNFNGTKSSNSGSFSTTLQQFVKLTHSLNANSNGVEVGNPSPSPANVWIKGRWAKTNDDRDDVDEESDFGIIYLGADYRFSGDLLIGLLGQYDWFDESSQGFGSKAEGEGWMIGPYLVSRLKDNLTMDVRAAWGQSDNKINPIGSYWDSYDSERWQVEGNLTGSFREGNWHVASNLGLNYFKETQESYIDSNGFTIPEQSTELGTLSFGPKITYMANGYDGSRVHPFITVKGVWDFKAPDIFDVNGIASGTEELRAQVGFGISIFTNQGVNVQASYTYDGIGINDYESHSAELSAIVPLEDSGFPKGSSLRASYSLQNVLMLQTEDSQAGKVELSIPFD